MPLQAFPYLRSPAAAVANNRSTNSPLTESVLRENGTVLAGLSDAAQFGDFSTIPGNAYAAAMITGPLTAAHQAA